MKNEWRKVAADDSERDYDMNVYLIEKNQARQMRNRKENK